MFIGIHRKTFCDLPDALRFKSILLRCIPFILSASDQDEILDPMISRQIGLTQILSSGSDAAIEISVLEMTYGFEIPLTPHAH